MARKSDYSPVDSARVAAMKTYEKALRLGYSPPSMALGLHGSPVEQVDRDFGEGGYNLSQDLFNLGSAPELLFNIGPPLMVRGSGPSLRRIEGLVGKRAVKVIYLPGPDGESVKGQVRVKGTSDDLSIALAIIEQRAN